MQGTNLGDVRIWVPFSDAGGVWRVRRVETFFPNMRLADPAAVVCAENGDDIKLLFAAKPLVKDLDVFGAHPEFAHHFYGIWRGTAVPDGTRLLEYDGDYGVSRGSGVTLIGTVSAVYGRDFFVSPATDIVARSRFPGGYESSALWELYIDPDPARLEDGSYQVYFGIDNETWAFVNQPLQRVMGDAEDMCADWLVTGQRAIDWWNETKGEYVGDDLMEAEGRQLITNAAAVSPADFGMAEPPDDEDDNDSGWL